MLWVLIRIAICCGYSLESWVLIRITICCGYSLELPGGGDSNEYPILMSTHNICFYRENVVGTH